MSKIVADLNLEAVVKPTDFYTVKLPHGLVVQIRERNGADEAILSRLEDLQAGTAIPKFLSAIIVEPAVTPDDIQKWPLRSKYWLMLKERIWCYGPDMTFSHSFKDKSIKEFSFNLEDYKTEDYPVAPHIEYTTSSGKVVKMDYLTGEGESKTLGKPSGTLDITLRFTLRNFQVKVAGAYQKIERFDMFTAKEMRELRKVVEERDPELSLLETLVHPGAGENELVSLMGITDFFFPKD